MNIRDLDITMRHMSLTVLFVCCIVHLYAAPDKQKAPLIETYFQAQPGKDSVRCIPGMFNTYIRNNHYYWEIPDSLLGRDMMVATIILKGAERQERQLNVKYGYGGDQIGGPLIVRFKKEQGKISVCVPFWDRLPIDSLNHLLPIICQNSTEGVIREFIVEAEGECSVLVDVTSWLKSSVFSLSPFSYIIGVGGFDAAKSYIKEIKGLPQNVIVRSVQYFRERNNDQALTCWEIGVSVCLLPKEPYRPRYADSRVGYFAFGLQDLNISPYQLKGSSIIRRWRMQPREEDLERYQRGELVEPRRPIIFYIDRETPDYLVPHFIHSVNVWQKAFEKAGFKHAIEARLAPTPAEDPDFSVDDIRHSFISYKSSPISNAYGPTMIDPRTGEILCSHIGVYTSIFQLVQRWYFTQCGLTDSRARAIVLPDSLLGWLSELVITHEIGHTLGLSHNFMGSNAYSVAQLRDTGFVKLNGFGTSIMDYMRFNYVAQPEDGFKPEELMPRLGPCDEFAIEWGYRYFPNMEPAEERKYLDKWVSEKMKNRLYRFGEEDGNDPRSQAEDLSDDHVEANVLAIENLRKLMAIDGLWDVKNRLEKEIMRDRYYGILTQYRIWVKHIIGDIGGRYVLSDSCQQTGILFRPVSRIQQERALDFLNKYLFPLPAWLFSGTVIEVVGIDAFDEQRKLYEELIRDVVFQMEYMVTNECFPDVDTYTVNEYIEKLHECIFQSWRQKKKLTREELEIQRIYISQLKEAIKSSGRNKLALGMKLRSELRRLAAEAGEYAASLPVDTNKKSVRELASSLLYWLDKN